VRVVLDAGPVIHLSWLHRLDLLPALFEEVLLPPEVRDEVLAAPDGTPGLSDIRAALERGHLTVRAAPPGSTLPSPSPKLGDGEVAAIALAAAVSADLLVSDDAAARREAAARGLTVTGTIGVLVAGREQGRIDAVLPHVLELRRLGLWVSQALIDEIGRDERRTRP
jgi:predicted nucleic acid-binding protein